MKRALLDHLACPCCGAAPLALAVTRSTRVRAWHAQVGVERVAQPGLDLDQREVEEILDGTLSCSGCGTDFPVSGGIPRLLPDPGSLPPTSAHAWTTFDGAAKVWEDNFLDLVSPLTREDFLGKRVLDAGCGFGRHTFHAARYGAEVVAMDLSPEAVDAARRNTEGLYNVHVVQGDILHPPFREGVFDNVLCLGVLHHVDAARDAFRRLSALLVTGGRMSTWTYGPRQGFASTVSRGLRAVTTQLEPQDLHKVSRVVARGLRLFSHTPYRLLEPVPMLRGVVTHLPVHDHHQWPMPVVVADIYDRLRIPVTVTLTGEAVERWYEEEGYVGIAVTRRVRNNESFRGTGVRR